MKKAALYCVGFLMGMIVSSGIAFADSECISGYGQVACGYNCVSGYGQVKCASTPEGTCMAQYGTVVCSN